MNKEELAKLLDGCEYTKEVSREVATQAKENNLVIVFGGSDDLIELNGAINDDLDCYEGGIFKITKHGILNSFEGLVDDGAGEEEFAEYFKLKPVTNEIEAVWNDGEPWTYKTDVPHSTFNVMRDGEIYCVGLVFSLTDLKSWAT